MLSEKADGKMMKHERDTAAREEAIDGSKSGELIKRTGFFQIPVQAMEGAPETVAEVFKVMKFVPFKCERHWLGRSFEFFGVSHMFEIHQENAPAPEYIIRTEAKDGKLLGVTVTMAGVPAPTTAKVEDE